MKTTLKNKDVVVLGLGETGLSALRWLRKQGAILSVCDTRLVPPSIEDVKQEMPEVAILLGEFDSARLCAADLIVLSPGIALATLEIQKAITEGVLVVGDVELFAQYRPERAKVIAITGSNGKSTVTSLVGEMCKKAGLNTIVAGNIGLPVLDTLSMPAADVYVIELSSFQLETTSSLEVDAATMLNLTEDHMDRYSDITAYAQAKARIFYHAKYQVLNRDDAWSMVMLRPEVDTRTFGLGADEGQFCLINKNDEVYLGDGNERLIKAKDVTLKGNHNLANALAAVALCRSIGLEYADLLSVLKSFKGLPHRMTWVSNIGGVDFLDDSKGTNVGAACAALSGLSSSVVLIAGGDGKGQDFAPLRKPVSEHARAVVLIGKDGNRIEEVLLSTDVPLYRAQDMREAVAMSNRLAKAGDTVLLSPACASFDMYDNYVHRAEAFIAAIKRLELAAC